jgi:large subunit ribosomal protein L18
MKGKLTKKIKGTSERPRLVVFRSLSHIYAQVIDDEKGVTLASASTITKKGTKRSKNSNNMDGAKKIGTEIAKRAIEAGVKKVVFDRGGKVYHGKIAALADAARAGGLEF